MKTAISIPDDIFAQAEERAADLGISRSEFYTRAAHRYLAQLDEESLTGQINDAIEMIGTADESGEAAVAAGRRHLAGAEEDW